MTKREHLRALARICHQFGGQLAIISQRAYDDLFDHRLARECGYLASPFTDAHGVHWGKKTVYSVRGREEVGSIIHEMGHVFADEHDPEHRKCSEWAWFGWEIALARHIGAARTWSRQNGNYNVGGEFGESGDWSLLSAAQRRAVVADRLAHAHKIGVLDVDGAPRSIR